MITEDSRGVLRSRKIYTCSHCGKLFKTKWNKMTHERIHTGAKPFTCELCGKAFNVKSNLKAHMVTHYKNLGESFQDYS